MKKRKNDLAPMRKTNLDVIFNLLWAAGLYLMASQLGKYKFKQTEFEGVTTIVIHPKNTPPVEVAATNYNHHYAAYHILEGVTMMHVFFDVPEILSWLEARKVQKKEMSA